MNLIFIYNAKSGILNGMMDAAHKLFSPSTYACSLCGVTYGNTGMKKEWSDYLDSLNCKKTFLYQDTISPSYRAIAGTLPAILIDADGSTSLMLSSANLNQCKQVADIIQKLNSALREKNIGLTVEG